MKIAIAALFTALMFNHASAEDIRYVSDVFYAPLRSGKGNEYRIINKGIRSGTKLLLLNDDPENGWSLVKTESGEQGWMPRQYLQAEPTAAARLATMENTISKFRRLEAENKELAAALSEKELLDQLHQTLVKQHQLLQVELEVLKAENARLADDSRHKWFLYGAGAVGLGVIITLIVPSLRPRKHYSEWA